MRTSDIPVLLWKDRLRFKAQIPFDRQAGGLRTDTFSGLNSDLQEKRIE